MVDYPNKPQQGQDVGPFISKASLWSALLDMLAAWRNGTLLNGQDRPKMSGQTRPIARNDSTTDILEVGNFVQLTDLDSVSAITDPTALRLTYSKPIFPTELDPVWQKGLKNIVMVHRSIAVGAVGPIRSRRYIAVEVDWKDDQDETLDLCQYVMPDPSNMKICRRAHSGIYKIVGGWDTKHVLVDTYQDQPIWTYYITGPAEADPDDPDPVVRRYPILLSDKEWKKFEYDGKTWLRWPANTLREPAASGNCVNIGEHFFPLDVDPAIRIRVKIKACIKFADTTGTGYFGPGDSPDWRIVGSGVPLEAVKGETTGDFEIAFNNTYKLDAVTDSLVTLERKVKTSPHGLGVLGTEKEEGSPVALRDVPDNTEVYEWELVEVKEQDRIARWCKTQDPASGVLQGATFWEGADPYTECPPTVTCAFDCSCLDAEDFGIGCYDPEADTYRIISTDSALMGPGTQVNIITDNIDFNDDCGLDYPITPAKVFCAEEPTPGSAQSGLQKQQVVSYVNLDPANCGAGLQVTYSHVYVCKTDAPTSADIYQFDLCQFICDCCEDIVYSSPSECGPPPPPFCNCEDCYFEGADAFRNLVISILGESLDWVYVPGTATQSGDPCSWSVDMTNGTETRSGTSVTYNGNGQWTVIFTGTPNTTFEPFGSCGGGTSNNPQGTADLVMDSIQCVNCDCCDECGPNGNDSKCLRLASLDFYGAGGDCCNFVRATLGYPDGSDVPEDLRRFTGCGFSNIPMRISWTVAGGGPDDHEGSASLTKTATGWIAEVTWDAPDGDACPGVTSMSGEFVIDDVGDICGADSFRQTQQFPPCEGATIDMLIESVDQPCEPTLPPLAALATPYSPPGKRPEVVSLGTKFAAENKDLFKGCNCKSDVVRVMNRWDTKNPKPETILTVAKTISNKNTQVTVEDVLQRLRVFFEKLKDNK